jgi:biopolymer transport protein ExbD
VSWKVRHQGSPQSIDNLTLAQVIEGLREGLWEPTDEVTAPQDRQWTSIENHPQLAEVALDIEPPPEKLHEDETHLDMTPLIDVTMVLLIFFILLLSYAQLQKAIQAAGLTKGMPVFSRDQVDKIMIVVQARPGPDGNPVVRLEKEVVDLRELREKLTQAVKDERKTILLIDATGVPERVVVAIEDAATGTGITERRYLKQGGQAPPRQP